MSVQIVRRLGTWLLSKPNTLRFETKVNVAGHCVKLEPFCNSHHSADVSISSHNWATPSARVAPHGCNVDKRSRDFDATSGFRTLRLVVYQLAQKLAIIGFEILTRLLQMCVLHFTIWKFALLRLGWWRTVAHIGFSRDTKTNSLMWCSGYSILSCLLQPVTLLLHLGSFVNAGLKLPW